MSTQARPEQRDDAGAKTPSQGAGAALAWLTAAIAFGAAFGFFAGVRTAVRPALDAAATMDRADASGLVHYGDYAQLLDDMRQLRAEMEQIRHEGETAQAAAGQSTHDLAARLARLEARMARIDSIDMTPTGSIAKDRTGLDRAGADRAGLDRPALYNHRARP